MKGLRMKLFASMSIIVLVLSMLIIGVWAVEEGKQIHLKGSVDFTMSDNNLYIRDIRRRKAGSTEQGTTIDNFLPGFVESTSFILKLGPLEADSDFELVIDVVNTTETTYQVNTTYNVTNGTITASGKIEGNGVPLAQVTTADISGQIILNVEISVIGTVDIGEIEVPVDEYVPKIYDYFTFSKNSDGKSVTLTGYDKNLLDSTDIVIPATVSQNENEQWIEGGAYTVTAIADGDLSNGGVFTGSGITSIELPSTLTSIGLFAFLNCSGLTGDLNLGECTSLSIGGAAFYGCSGFTGLTLPDSLMSIGDLAFYNCSGLKGELNLGECTSLTSIGYAAFQDCSGFTDLILPEGLISIGDTAFYGCSSLTSITLPEGLTSIGYGAFSGCSSLTSITLPESLTSMGYAVFRNCDSLASVTFENTTGWVVSTSPDMSNSSSVDVTNPNTNATYLKNDYVHYYWQRNV